MMINLPETNTPKDGTQMEDNAQLLVYVSNLTL